MSQPRSSQPQPVVRHTDIRTRRSYVPWTMREETYLRDHYADWSVTILAAKLGRQAGAVKRKIAHLGLHKRYLVHQVPFTGEFYRISAIATGLGLTEDQVWRWVRAGLLGMRAGWIAGADLAAFLRSHPGAVDVRALPAEQRRWAQALLGEGGRQAIG